MTRPDSNDSLRPPAPPGGPEQLLRPDDLRRIMEEKERAATREQMERASKREEQQKELFKTFSERHLHPEAGKRFSTLVRQAAERGERRVEILRFPSDWCTDRGRAINNFEADWPRTLTGIAKEGYEAFDKWLRPLGYKMSAQILDYPGGVPGDVGIFISW